VTQLRCSDDCGGKWIFGLSRSSSPIRWFPVVSDPFVSVTYRSAENINGRQCCREDYSREDEKNGGYDGGCGEDNGGCD
jgi:hypothetical protein